jgi:energy-converting hydrogenase Eha subunit G
MSFSWACVNKLTITMKTFAIILIVIGGIMTVFTGFTLITKKEVADIGPLEINKEEKTPIYWSPITGGILLAAGIIAFVASRRTA